jgi:Circadian oscillating protein COP23
LRITEQRKDNGYIQKTSYSKHPSFEPTCSLLNDMKRSSLRPILIAATLGLMAVPVLMQPSQAETQGSSRFFCGASINPKTGEKTPMTMARTQRGNVAMIRWKSTFFNNARQDFTPMNRCMEVSRRFQTFYSQGILSYLTTGVMNDQNVICVAEEYGGPCSGLLLTLEPKDNPQQVLKELMDIRNRASGPITRSAGPAYFDVEQFLETAPVQTEPVTPN